MWPRLVEGSVCPCFGVLNIEAMDHWFDAILQPMSIFLRCLWIYHTAKLSIVNKAELDKRFHSPAKPDELVTGCEKQLQNDWEK